MAEDLTAKKIIKKKIKLKVSSSEKPSSGKTEEELKKSPDLKIAPIKENPKSETPVQKPPFNQPRRFEERTDNRFPPRQAPFDRSRRPDFNRAPGTGRPGEGGGPRGNFQRPGPGGAPGQKRTFIPRDKSPGGAGFRGRSDFRAAKPEPLAEKDTSRRAKFWTPFTAKSKGSFDKEKTKSKEEEILLSKMEDSIRKKSKKGEAAIPTEIEIGDVITIADLAKKMNLKAGEIIQRLIDLGVSATINDNIDSDTATIVASEFNCKIKVRNLKEEVEIKEEEDLEKDLSPRFPIVTIMGHVDHGKTKLLDAIRDSNVAEHESGGITQHIGAYRVKTKKGEIAFVDTPGHEAFTAMRARGANVTDIVILVVSAVDGVMPQTVEALHHAQAAKVPIIVAVNKVDLPDANIERVKQQLAEHSILSEDWGGQSIFVPVSALKKTGIQELLDAILLQAEVIELKANPNKKGIGYVVESKMDIGRGAVATVIVKNGSVKVGDNFVVGTAKGKVRGMFDENGKKIALALPSYPVEIMGFDDMPNAGDRFYIVENEEIAKQISEKRLHLKKIEEHRNIKKIQIQNAMEAITAGSVTELKVIIKGDVQGSVEAIKTSLSKISQADIKVTVIHAGVGSVLESDVMLATATANTEEIGVGILAFRVRVDSIAKEKAESEGITIKRFNIIYELLDYVEGLVKGMHKPEVIEHVIGTAEIKELFKIKDIGKIAGCMVTDGYIRKAEKVRIFREGVQVWEGKVSALKRFQEDASEVQVGFEFGVSFVNYENFKKGDVIECFTSEIKKVA
jgi:translation initiation factor IF-2